MGPKRSANRFAQVVQLSSKVMLGRDCLRAVSRKQFPPRLKLGKKWVFVNIQYGFKVGAKVGFDPFRPTFCTQKPTFGPILDPFQPIDKKPILNPL